MIKFVHLKTGWKDKDFEDKLNNKLQSLTEYGWEYYDVKVSSGTNNTLLVLKSK